MSKIAVFIAAAMAAGMSHLDATGQACTYFNGGSPIYNNTKHTKMSYAKQNRLAKARRNRSMYKSKSK